MSRGLEAVSRIGAAGLVLGSAAVARNRVLRARYQFDNWHVRATYHLKPYKKLVVDAVNGTHPQTVVEVGCGLGDVVARVNARDRIGVDIEREVVSAARVLHRGVEFLTGSIESLDEVLPARVARIDALIMINWPHLIAAPTLSGAIADLAVSRELGLVFIDGIHPGSSGYAHHHGPAELGSIGEVIEVHRDIDSVRDLYVVQPAGKERMSS